MAVVKLRVCDGCQDPNAKGKLKVYRIGDAASLHKYELCGECRKPIDALTRTNRKGQRTPVLTMEELAEQAAAARSATRTPAQRRADSRRGTPQTAPE